MIVEPGVVVGKSPLPEGFIPFEADRPIVLESILDAVELPTPVTLIEPCIAADCGVASEGWSEPEGRGVIGWQTLISAGMTPTAGLTAGIATLEPGGFLAPHRHAPDEIYFVVEGEAVATIDGIDRPIIKGDCAFIPGMAEHGLRNVSALPMRFLYVFPVDGFDDVTYLFSNPRLDGTA